MQQGVELADIPDAGLEMVGESAAVETVAQRFGKTKLYIHKRMILADVLEAYK
jgi:hypothetical protein